MLQFEELCTAVGTLVGSESTDSVALLQALEGMAQVHLYMQRVKLLTHFLFRWGKNIAACECELF